MITIWKTMGTLFLLATLVPTLPLKAEDASEPASSNPFLGVRLAREPLPPLLAKHLQMDPDAGLLVLNVIKDSPADKAGIEKDDVIYELQGNPVKGYDPFVQQILSAGVGTEIKIGLIHLGQRKTISASLEPAPSSQSWKYPAETAAPQPMRPGRIFRMNPNDQNWQQIPFHNMPDLRDFFGKHYRQSFTYRVTSNGNDLEITVQGNPNHPNSQITVNDKTNNKQYTTAANKIEDLPEVYREAAKNSIESARQSAQNFDFDFQIPFDGNQMSPPPSDQDNQIQELLKRLEQMEQQQKEMQQRFDELEKNKSKDL